MQSLTRGRNSRKAMARDPTLLAPALPPPAATDYEREAATKVEARVRVRVRG